MRDCLFLVADKNMEGMLRGFFSREGFHRSLGCATFTCDPARDICVAHGQNDPGLYTRAAEFLRPYRSTHRHAVVIMDAEWDGSPGALLIREQLQRHLQSAGWSVADGCAVVIDPELENWIWQDSLHVTGALGVEDPFPALRAQLTAKGFWTPGGAKPFRPKEAVEWSLRMARIPRSSSIYRQVAATVSVRNCSDPAFRSLVEALRRWFPLTNA